MLNILKKDQKNFNYQSLNNINNAKNIQTTYEKDEHNNIIYYPSSSKEWFGNIYSYNKSYLKSLVVYDVIVNKLFRSYSNMLQYKIKILFKRRRHNKSRYSSNKIFVSKAEVKHTNTKLFIILYTYNKQKSSIEESIRKFATLSRVLRVLGETSVKHIVKDRNEFSTLSKNKTLVSKRVYDRDDEGNRVLGEQGNPLLIYIVTHWNRFVPLLKNNFSVFKKWNTAFFRINNNLLNYLALNLKTRKLYKTSTYNIAQLKKLFKVQKLLFNNIKLLNFNKSKFNNFVLNWRNLGLIKLIQKIFNKKVEIKLVELKSIHLNSDVFSSAIALKLRDRQNKAVKVLRRAIIQMVKIPDLHTLITFDDNIETINKNNILNTIKQQVVSGVRFEASGRLTRRLTAMRAVFKYRYVGSLKNIRSSFNTKSSTMLRGHVKANSQYTIINSKTRNGSFGLKGWVSSH
jgi:hypothetical protein